MHGESAQNLHVFHPKMGLFFEISKNIYYIKRKGQPANRQALRDLTSSREWVLNHISKSIY